MRLLTSVALASAALLAAACGGDGGGDGGDGGAGSPGSSGPGVGGGLSCGESPLRTGEATYYDFADGSGNCSFPATPEDLRVAAMNAVDYDQLGGVRRLRRHHRAEGRGLGAHRGSVPRLPGG
ncbi:MAG: hypothetical protein WKG00_19515 [Polyangiaceae bacterium]